MRRLYFYSNLDRIISLYLPGRNLNPGTLFLFLPILVTTSLVSGFLIFIIQRLLNKKLVIRLGRLSSDRIGHLILEFDWYISSSNSRSLNQKYLDLFFFRGAICNEFAGKFISERVKVVSRNALLGAYLINRIFRFEKYIIPLPERPNDLSLFDREPPAFSFNTNQVQQAQTILEKLGISEGQKIVCLYVRDGAYEKTLNGVSGESTAYRNASLKNYYASINFLISLGYKVIRMGSEVEKEFEIQSRHFIDYANSEYKSDLLDFFIPYISEFVIATDSGTMLIPISLRKNFVLPNIPALHGLPITSYLKYFQFKSWIDSSTGELININNYLDRGAANADCLEDFTKLHISFIENSESELLQLVKQMVIDSKDGSSTKDEILVNLRLRQLLRPYLGGDYQGDISKFWVADRPNFLEA